jgi:hypothetical protein
MLFVVILQNVKCSPTICSCIPFLKFCAMLVILSSFLLPFSTLSIRVGLPSRSVNRLHLTHLFRCQACGCGKCGGKDSPESQLICDQCQSSFHLKVAIRGPKARIMDRDPGSRAFLTLESGMGIRDGRKS